MGFRRTATTISLTLTFIAASALPASAHNHRIFYKPPKYDVTSRPIGKIAATVPSAIAARLDFRSGAKTQSRVVSSVLTRNPDSDTILDEAFTTPDETCAAPLCSEITVDVPAGKPQTLYARASWSLPSYYVHIWGISPEKDSRGNNLVVGAAQVASSFNKETGNERTIPVSEFHVANPAAGTWRIQTRAVFGYQIPVATTVALTKAAPVAFDRLGVRELADKYLTQHLDVNIVFAGRHWSPDEVAAFRDRMPLEYRTGVLSKQSDDCEGSQDDGFTGYETLLNWGVCHYSGTETPNGPVTSGPRQETWGVSGYVPYFEPIKFNLSYSFLEADETWTKDLFQKAKDETTQNAPFDNTDASKYLALYDASDGKLTRDAAHLVTDPTVSDKIDAFAVEDWIAGSSHNATYAHSFKNLETGASRDASFILPDAGGYFDPFYTKKGHKDLETMPQGTATSLTFFVLDTYSASYAADYFRPNAYHHWDVSGHMIDPDVSMQDGPDWSRVWGGRYRFFFHDIGAGPNHYEAIDFFLGAVPGSAAKPYGDPPVWDYDDDPFWKGLLVDRTARDAVTMLLYRFIAPYLYRPIPADVYFLASNNWEDCYSNPVCDPEGISHTVLEKIYRPNYVEKNLAAALPGVTFTTERSDPHLKTYRYLGCAKDHAVRNTTEHDVFGIADDSAAQQVVLVPDPNCVGKPSDPIQEILELAKARGDDVAGVGLNDFGASAAVVRAWVEEHRDEIAPLRPGQFTLTNISVVWPGGTTWDLPAIVGGVAFGTPNNEIWGILNNTNDRSKPSEATDCSVSKPFAPGCNGVPKIRDHGAGFSYTVQHEASHFLGLLHPHDSLTVEKDTEGKWRYYGYSYRHYGDHSMAPTTYAGSFAPYSVLDQDIIQRGHAAEYLRMAQDSLADAYLQDGIAGLASPSAATLKKVAESNKWRDMASQLFACGDYLKSERAMRNAFLSAQGVYGPVVSARALKPGERVLFKVNPQRSYDSHGKAMPGCAGASASVLGKRAQRKTGGHLPATGSGDVTLLGMLLVAAAALMRRFIQPAI